MMHFVLLSADFNLKSDMFQYFKEKTTKYLKNYLYIMTSGTPLLSTIELHQTDNNEITVDLVSNNHQLFMHKEKTMNANKLIEILGGTDAILQHYLSSKDSSSQLTTKQLHQINELLVNDTNTGIHGDILLASSENTFLHLIFGPKIGSTIRDIMYSRMMLFIIGLVLLTWFITVLLAATDIVTSVVTYNISHIIIYSVVGVFEFLLFWTLNRTTTKLILQTFEIYFKMIFFVEFWIFSTICYGEWAQINMTLNTIYNIITCMGVLLFCLVDGLKMSFGVKATLSMLVVSLFTLSSVYWSILYTTPSHRSIHLWNGYSFDLDAREWTANAIRILTIFAWKQTIYSIFKAPKSPVIMSSIKIQWL